MNHDRLLERFLRYVQVDTTAKEGSGSYPSSPGQWELGKILVEELKAAGAVDAAQDEHGVIYATLKDRNPVNAPVIAFCAHLDTSPETTGKGVKPQVIRSYAGGDIALSGDQSKVIRVAENPELASLHGKTLITTDGTTLLGADDKAGLAAIIEAVAFMSEHPEICHGDVRVLLTCDEEIGHGVDHVDLTKLGAVACYTLDGGEADQIDVETFSADLAEITVRGVNIHPSIAKGRMINALRVASNFIERWPRDTLAPEVSAERQGFLHPYVIEGLVAEVRIRALLRDFDTPVLAKHAERLREMAKATMAEFPGSSIEVKITPQYRNMRDGLPKEPRAVEYAVEAFRRLGREPKLTIIRGGTDGSRLTEKGLPTPNLSTGEHNPHSPLEWTCLEEIAAAAESIVSIARVWREKSDK